MFQAYQEDFYKQQKSSIPGTQLHIHLFIYLLLEQKRFTLDVTKVNGIYMVQNVFVVLTTP